MRLDQVPRAVKFEAGGPPLRHAARQDFGIADFRWLHMAALESAGLSAALVTVEPGTRWEPHRHSGYEQVTYILRGRGRQAVNGEWHDIAPGLLQHLPDGITHALENSGCEPMRFLAIYNPVHVSLPLPSTRPELPRPEPLPGLRELVPSASLQKIQDVLAEATGLGVMVVDAGGASLTVPSNLPRFCRLIRERDPGHCHILASVALPNSAGAPREDSPRFHECCHGIVGFSAPIGFEGVSFGAVLCGFVLLEPPQDRYLAEVRVKARAWGMDPDRLVEAYRAVPVVLNTPLRAAAESLQAVTSSLVELAAREGRERLLREYNEKLARETEVVRNLEGALAETQLRLLQAQFSPHFLFNALNMIASSIAASDPESERMVYALSDFLRYVISRHEGLVPLRQEVKCVRDYLTIQQNRFGSALRVSVEVPPGLERAALPSLILQPLVENAVIHGLGPRNYEGEIRIQARKAGRQMEIEVSDDGVGLPEGLLIELPRSSLAPGQAERAGLGLRLVRQKLQLHYGSDARLSLSSDRESGTRVTVSFPHWNAGRRERLMGVKGCDSPSYRRREP